MSTSKLGLLAWLFAACFDPAPPFVDPSPTDAAASVDALVRCEQGGRFADHVYTRDQIEKRTELYRTVTDSYGTHQLRLDLHLPPLSAQAPLRPAIVWLHGGNFRSGTRAEMTDYAIELARRGWVSATIEYRQLKAFDPNVTIDLAAAAARDDAEAAIAFLRDGAIAVDPARIAIGGFSAGSITAFTLAYEYERFAPPKSSAIGLVALDGLGSQASDLASGDPPFVMFRSSDTPTEDPTIVDNFLAAIGEFPHEVFVIPNTVHADLVEQPFIQDIAAKAAAFLHAYALACAEA